MHRVVGRVMAQHGHRAVLLAAVLCTVASIASLASSEFGLGLASPVLAVLVLAGLAVTALVENSMRRQREEELRIQNLCFDMALAHMGEGLCMFDAQKRLVVCNGRYAQLYRLPDELLKPGTPHHAIIRHRVLKGVLKGEHSHDAAEQVIVKLSALPADATSSRVDELADGRLICVTRQPMAGGGWVTTHVDVTEQRRSHDEIAHMAQHDALTALPNRVLLHRRLDHALAGARRGTRKLAVLMLDLDRFKEVNDRLGHAVGDALLKAVTLRLRGCVREAATIARLGGDEFAIVEDMADPAPDATALAERIQRALSLPFDLGEHHLIAGASIGIAIAPNDGTSTDEILKKADLALYRAKASGRAAYRFFEPEMDELMQARRVLEYEMRAALRHGEFELHYQPFVDLKTDEITGFEALLRWRHPARGLIAPSEFIALAEETGLIIPVGEWVVRAACAEAAMWPIPGLKVAVNLSPAQFRSAELVAVVTNALANSGLAPHRLEIEVTEQVMHESPAVFSVLDQLHRLGVRVALDDFGTGYSSLDVLKRFAFDKIKIDRVFVNELLGTNEQARAIARALVRFAVSLGKTTTAEGVETKEQLEVLCAEECTEVQGYYFSQPQHASQIHQLLRTRVKAEADAA